MAARISWVPYGRPAADALRSAIAAAKGDEPLAAVTVVVSANHLGVASRRLLASGVLGPTCGRGTGLVGVSFLTPYRLAELLAAGVLAATGRRPVSTPVVAAALRAALSEEPGLFAAVAQHPATETALVTAYRELRDLSPRALAALAAAGGRAAEVVRLHGAARARLAEAWYDEEDLMQAAAAVLRREDPVAAQVGSLIVHLPQLLSRHAAGLLGAAAERREVLVLAGTTGEPAADGEVITSLRRMGFDSPSPPEPKPSAVASADRTVIVSASDADEEVRTAVRTVVDAVRAGTPLDRIAVLHASAVPYARLVHEHLAAAGVPTNGAAVVPLTARVAARTLLQLFALPERGFRRQDLFAWLAGAPVLLNGRWAPVAAWERLSREATVVAGRDQWDQRLTALARRLTTDADRAQADPDQPAWKAERARADATRALELREFVLHLVDDLSQAAAPRSWGEHAVWAHERLTSLLGEAERRVAWPADEHKAGERVAQALDRLAALDGVEGPVELATFTRTLQLELEADLGRIGRLGEGVLVGGVGLGIGLDLDLVVVLGMAEGTFPSTLHDDSLLPDHERALTGGELPLRSHRVEREHRELLATLAGSTSQVLCMPRGDLRRSSERVPSRWLLDVASTMAGTRWWSADLKAARVPWVRHIASFDAGLRTLGFPATEQEHRLRSLLARPEDACGHSLVGVPDEALAGGAEVVLARRSAAFTRFDGNIAPLHVPSPVERIMSPTRLEQWATCPFAYLLRYVLGVESVENPEDQLRMTAIDRGDLVHRALEQFITEVLDRPAHQQPGPDDPWSTADQVRLQAIGEALCDEYEARGRSGRAVFWHRDRRLILADLERFLKVDNARRRDERTRPLAAELEFGFHQSPLAPVCLDLPDGRSLRFLGKADRVDSGEDGTIHIVDYKTGKSDNFRGLNAEDPDRQGCKLQLPVYGAAARQHHAEPGARVRAEYWFVSAKGQFDSIGFDIDDDVLERVGRTLGTMVEGIEAGVFPPHPTAKSTSLWVDCPYCDPDALGVMELRRHWERKRFDPALAPYAELAEPLEGILRALEEGTGDD